MFGDSVFCNLWAMLWQIAIRVSVFLVGMLSITRVISILKPIYVIRYVTLQLPLKDLQKVWIALVQREEIFTLLVS